MSLAGYTGAPSGRNATWGQRRFDSDDWTERTTVVGRDEVQLTVIRSYDAKALYHHPELAVTSSTFTGTEVRRFAQHRTSRCTCCTRTPGRRSRCTRCTMTAPFVQDPIRFQLRTAGELLFSGRKAMTLFFLRRTRCRAASRISSRSLARAVLRRHRSVRPARRSAQ